MDNIAGSPVEGEDFYGRQVELRRICESLQNHDVLLLGPRRIGKTSIARAVMAALREQGWHTIEINVAACIDERGFLEKLEAALRREVDSAPEKLWEAFKAALSKLAQRISVIKVPVPGAGELGINLGDATLEDWTTPANEALSLIASVDRRWLIYVDELPIFLYNLIEKDPATGVQRVRRFLDWFRNDVRGLPGGSKIRWLVSGSVGLDTLVQLHGMADTINSFKHDALPPFTQPQATEMLGLLCQRYEIALSTENLATLLAAVQWLQPYYIQFAFNKLRDMVGAQPGVDSTSLIEQALEQMSLPGSDNDFHHWEKRLFIQLPHRDAEHSVALLNLAAATREGSRPELLLAMLHARMPEATDDEAKRSFVTLRDILQRDAYWQPEGEGPAKRYRFQLEPLRRWWLRRNTL